MKVESFTDGQCVEDAFRVPVRSGPVEGLAVFDDLMETTTDLLKRSLIIIKVGIENVHVVQL